MSLEIEITSTAPGHVVMSYPFRRFLLDWIHGGNVWEFTYISRGWTTLPGIRLRMWRLRLHIMYSTAADRDKNDNGFSLGYIYQKFHFCNFWILKIE